MSTDVSGLEFDVEQIINSRTNFNALPAVCQRLELELPPAAFQKYYHIFLLSLLLENNLNDARFLWKRIPPAFKSADGELQAIWVIGQSMWKKAYADVYTAAQAFSWSAPNAPIVTSIIENYRKHMFQVLSKAYTTISVADAAACLGISPSTAVQECVQAGWTFDSLTNTLAPTKEVISKAQKTGQEQLQQLTDYIVHLERK
eukprot:GILK01004666.1.p1 GENE.GILK01004666.1~~GILK01004666.1.p1  ORF type:complete len:202 (+),score=31.64 GILK01004666.1:58-663(+)